MNNKASAESEKNRKETTKMSDEQFDVTETTDSKVIRPWPYNLLKSAQYSLLSRDQERGLEYALTMLSEREKKIILLRYKEDKTFAEIAEEISREEGEKKITGSRVQQIHGKAMAKLSHPSLARYYKEGFYAVETIELEQQMAAILAIKNELVSIKERLFEEMLDCQEMLDCDYEEKVMWLASMLGSPQEPFDIIKLLTARYRSIFKLLATRCSTMPISDLGISACTVNALARQDIKTVGQLLISDADLLKLRNIGDFSIKEINERFAEKIGISREEVLNAFTNDSVSFFYNSLNEQEARIMQMAKELDIPIEDLKKFTRDAEITVKYGSTRVEELKPCWDWDTYRRLRSAGFETLGDFAKSSIEDLSRSFDEKLVGEIAERFEAYTGYKLPEKR